MDKIMKHKVIILILTSLIIVGLLAFFFWFNNLRQQQKELIDFAPKNTWQYFEINFDNNNLNKLLKEDQSIKTVIEKFLIESNLPINIWKGECQIEKLALAKVITIADEKKTNEKVWLVYSSQNIKVLETLELKDYYLIFLTDEIVALTKSQPLAMKIKNNKRTYNLNFRRSKARGMIGGYLNLETYLNLIGEKAEYFQILDEYINLEEDANWQIDFNEQDELVAKINLPIKNSFIQHNFLDKAVAGFNNQKLIVKNNEDFITPIGTLVIRNFNGEILLGLLKDELAKQFNGEQKTFKDFLENKYKMDITRLYTFFEHPFFVVIDPENNQFALSDILNSQLVDKYNYALVWKNDDKFIQDADKYNLEKIIQNYLAFKFPIAKNKTLPDGTVGFELVADPTKIVWQSKFLEDGSEIRFLRFKDYEYAYIILENKFIFANSQKIIENILKAKSKTGVDEFYSLFVSPAVIKDLRATDLSEIYLGGDVKAGNLEIKVKLLDKQVK